MAWNIDRTLAVIASIVALGGAAYSIVSRNNNLEYMTRADWNTFQVEYVKRMTEVTGAVDNGFKGVTIQIANLPFVSGKDFQDFKDKVSDGNHIVDKDISALKKELETLQKTASNNTLAIADLKQKIAILEANAGKQ